VVRAIDIDFGKCRVTSPNSDDMLEGYRDKWEKFEDGLLLGRFNEVMTANERKHFERVSAFINQPPAMAEIVRGSQTKVVVTYYDPRLDRLKWVKGAYDEEGAEWKSWRNKRGFGRK
jgi:hypothetical protein